MYVYMYIQYICKKVAINKGNCSEKREHLRKQECWKRNVASMRNDIDKIRRQQDALSAEDVERGINLA